MLKAIKISEKVQYIENLLASFCWCLLMSSSYPLKNLHHFHRLLNLIYAFYCIYILSSKIVCIIYYHNVWTQSCAKNDFISDALD